MFRNLHKTFLREPLEDCFQQTIFKSLNITKRNKLKEKFIIFSKLKFWQDHGKEAKN